MPKKSLKCIVDVKIHVVSCPGVWLCSKGEVYLTLAMFGLEYQSKLLTPVFPLYIYEKYRFEKAYRCCSDPAEVSLALEEEPVYIELIQLCSDRRRENVLATYHASARCFLYPTPVMRPRYTSSEREVLLCITSNFPGVLSPKLEFCTSTLIRECGPCLSSKESAKRCCPKEMPGSRLTKYKGICSPVCCPEPECPSPVRCPSPCRPSSPPPPCPSADVCDSRCVVCRLYRKYFGKPYLGHTHTREPSPTRCKSPVAPCHTSHRCVSDSTLDKCDRSPPPCSPPPPSSQDDCYLHVPRWYYRYLLNQAMDNKYKEMYDLNKCCRWS